MVHDEPERRVLDIRIQKVISVWVRNMEALGVEVVEHAFDHLQSTPAESGDRGE